MNDAEILDNIRSKIRRINGHGDLSEKQLSTLRSLVQAAESIAPSGVDELFK